MCASPHAVTAVSMTGKGDKSLTMMAAAPRKKANGFSSMRA
jgi:hypothetical protein